MDVSDFNIWNNHKFTSSDTDQGTLTPALWKPENKMKLSEDRDAGPEVKYADPAVVQYSVARPFVGPQLGQDQFAGARRITRHETRHESQKQPGQDETLEAVFASWRDNVET